MKKLVLILAVLALYSCEERSANVDKEKTTYIVKEYYTPLEIVIVDSCEYLYGPWGNATVFTHKGNCKNHKP